MNNFFFEECHLKALISEKDKDNDLYFPSWYKVQNMILSDIWNISPDIQSINDVKDHSNTEDEPDLALRTHLLHTP